MAQSMSTGAVIGVVKDASGKPLAGAQVRAASGQTTRTVVTNDQGQYRFGLLGLGKWTVTVAQAGYQTSSAPMVVGINDTLTLNFKLAAVAAATVAVNANAEALDVATTQTTTTFDSEHLAQLPANFTSVNALDAIVSTVPGVQSTGGNNFQFFGGTQDQNLFVVDGNNTNSTRKNQSFSWVGGLPPKEFMESIEVVTGGFGAEYNVLGGVINMATKTGSNTWAGDAFWYTNFPNATAKQLYNEQAGQATPTPYATSTRYGVTVSGPLVKDKVFFFLGVQGAQTKTPAQGEGGANWNGYVSSPATNDGPNTFSAKVNWIINSDHELVLATTNVKQSFDEGNAYPNPGNMNGLLATGSGNVGNHGYYENQTTNLTWNWTITPSLFLVTSLGNHTDPYHLYPNAPLTNGVALSFYDYQYFLSGPGANAPNKPANSEYYAYVGGNLGLAISQTNPNKQVRLDLTWAPRNHTVKVGYSLQQARFDSSGSDTAAYSIYSDFNNYGMTGDPTDLEYLFIGGYNVSQKATYTGYYAKDLWEIVPGLRLDYGLRFDSLCFVGNNPPIVGQQLLNFSNFHRQMQPRLGLAWDVHKDGKTKLYANFGRFFETMPMQNFAWASASVVYLNYWNASQWAYNSSYTNTQVPYTINTDPATGRPYAPYQTFSFGSTSQNPPMANDLRLPHKDMLLLGGDQVLKGGWSVGATWRYWKIADALLTSYFSNPDGSNAFPGDVSSTVVWNPRPGPVTFTTGAGKVLSWDSPFPDPKEVFIALNLHANFQSEKGFLSANYTWTHHYGNYRGLAMAGTTANANSNTWGGGANSTSDWMYYQTINSGNNEANPVHEFKLSGYYAIPVLGQKLNVGPVFTWQSGYGLTAAIPFSNVIPGAFRGGYLDTAYNGIMSNYGHTPSFTNLDLNLNMVIKAGPMSVTPSAAITNVFNTRSVAGVYTKMQLPYGGGPDPFFGMPIGWQPGRAITAGVSVKF
jgi:hypothetical protein